MKLKFGTKSTSDGWAVCWAPHTCHLNLQVTFPGSPCLCARTFRLCQDAPPWAKDYFWFTSSWENTCQVMIHWNTAWYNLSQHKPSGVFSRIMFSYHLNASFCQYPSFPLEQFSTVLVGSKVTAPRTKDREEKRSRRLHYWPSRELYAPPGEVMLCLGAHTDTSRPFSTCPNQTVK